MGYKFDPKIKSFRVYVCKRHPVSRMPKSLSRITDLNGNPIESEEVAKAVEAKLLKQLETSLASQTSSMKFKTLLKKFYDNLRLRGLSLTTISSYELCLNAHALPLWGERKIDTIKPQEIVDLVKIGLAHRSVSHQKSMLKFVRGVFEFAAENGWVTRNPAPKLQFRTGNKIKPVLTREQARVLLEKAKEYEHEWYEVWTVALYTGCRNGELHALTWDKVDLENRTILISASWDKMNGFKDLTKSGEDRIVEIAPNLIHLLRELKIKNFDSPFVLPRIEAWDGGRQAEILRAFLYALGLPRIRFHDLRATWATIMLGNGVPPVKVMKMGGWRDLKTMMIYVRKAGIDIRGVTDAFDIHNPEVNSGAQVVNLWST